MKTQKVETIIEATFDYKPDIMDFGKWITENVEGLADRYNGFSVEACSFDYEINQYVAVLQLQSIL